MPQPVLCHNTSTMLQITVLWPKQHYTAASTMAQTVLMVQTYGPNSTMPLSQYYVSNSTICKCCTIIPNRPYVHPYDLDWRPVWFRCIVCDSKFFNITNLHIRRIASKK